MGDCYTNWWNKAIGKRLKDITDHLPISQIIEGPTRITSTSQIQIDLVYIIRPELIAKSCLTIMLTTKRLNHHIFTEQ